MHFLCTPFLRAPVFLGCTTEAAEARFKTSCERGAVHYDHMIPESLCLVVVKKSVPDQAVPETVLATGVRVGLTKVLVPHDVIEGAQDSFVVPGSTVTLSSEPPSGSYDFGKIFSCNAAHAIKTKICDTKDSCLPDSNVSMLTLKEGDNASAWTWTNHEHALVKKLAPHAQPGPDANYFMLTVGYGTNVISGENGASRVITSDGSDLPQARVTEIVLAKPYERESGGDLRSSYLQSSYEACMGKPFVFKGQNYEDGREVHLPFDKSFTGAPVFMGLVDGERIHPPSFVGFLGPLERSEGEEISPDGYQPVHHTITTLGAETVEDIINKYIRYSCPCYMLDAINKCSCGLCEEKKIKPTNPFYLGHLLPEGE